MAVIQEKIKKTSKGIAVALQVISILVIVVVALSALSFIAFLVPDAWFLSSLKEQVMASHAADTALFLLFFAAVAVMLALVAAVLRLLYRIFKDIGRECTPFAAKHVGRIKWIALLSLAASIAGSAVNALSGRILYGVGQWNIEPIWFLFAAIILCFAYIFDYGCQLQRLSDETL